MSAAQVHPSAVVAPGAVLSSGVIVGPHCIVGDGAVIGEGTRLISGVTIEGRTDIGRRCVLYPGVCVGLAPQVKGRSFEETRVVIGDDNILREHATVHGASKPDGVTRLGDRNFLMVNTHVAHDCALGSDITMANATLLGGHVSVEDGAVIGGMVGVHQFVRIGRLAMIGAFTKLVNDIAPYSIVDGNPAALYGANVIGLRRAGFKPEEVRAVRRALLTLLCSGRNLSLAQDEVAAELGQVPAVGHILDFIRASKRGVLRGSSAKDGEQAAIEEVL
ncbi:MAG: Acyl-[acyl-carrier-protein]--UDP-N-acetylglucosamine O-acyltransferase [Candidatus Omnitrophica bacterium]|nr:Acyl-[acyl-carrier-protein]--UDP-N-acetylglucosamine O-acyltransferase [Candidatus Omnitrophota bacterium]